MYRAELCVGCRRRGSLVTFRRKGSWGRPWPAGGVSLFMPEAPPTAVPMPMGAPPCLRCWTAEGGEGEEGRGGMLHDALVALGHRYTEHVGTYVKLPAATAAYTMPGCKQSLISQQQTACVGSN